MKVEITSQELDPEIRKQLPQGFSNVQMAITELTTVLRFAGTRGIDETLDLRPGALVGSLWVLQSIDEATGTITFGMARGSALRIPKIGGVP